MVFSEFGRRVMSNDSLGTDHGAGGMMLVSGSAVRGGLAGEHPGLTSLDDDGDLVVKTDFRTVYQALIAEWLGGDPNAILPEGPFAPIHRYDGGAAADEVMRRAACLAAVATVALTLVAGVADAGLGRRHRLFLPPPELPVVAGRRRDRVHDAPVAARRRRW